MEDQYLISPEAAAGLNARLPNLQHLTILIAASEISDLPCRWRYRQQFIDAVTNGLSAADAAKVRVFQLVTPPASTPPTFGAHTYVHSKTWVFDDELAVIGSANCNRRGWQSDSEADAFIFDDAPPAAGSLTFAQLL
ncbi:MAG: phospholipase D-like domain-containing protein, partial [Candidatus Cybelea sp.]